jgi:DNA-binding transcriptional regulator YdaS (Cro superfamily)
MDHVITRAIVEALHRPGWSQARLAKALAIRPQTVNKWAKGENVPPMSRWPAIEAALELAAGSFLQLVQGVVDLGQVVPTEASISDRLQALEDRFDRLEVQIRRQQRATKQ